MLIPIAARRTVTVVTALGALALSLSLAGCSTSSTTTGEETQSKYSNMDDWEAAMNSCLRDQGVDVSADGAIMFDEGQTQEEIEAVFTTCTEKVGAAPGMENYDDPQKVNESNQILVDCLQSKGYDIPDVKEGEYPVIPTDVNQNDADECIAASGEVFN